MKKQNNNKNILIFAEIGQSPISSQASKNLLIELIAKLNKEYSFLKIKLFFYPIFNFFSNTNLFLFFYEKKQNENSNFMLLSTSIKLIRDYFYMFQTFIIVLLNSKSIVYYYNLNKRQIFILRLLNLFLARFNIKPNLIQADGFVLNKSQLLQFKRLLVFSEIMQSHYLKYNKNVKFSLPIVRKSNLKYCPTYKYNKNKRINIVHCGAISSYNLPVNYLNKIIDLCVKNKNIFVRFTTSQNKVPNYFLKLAKTFPPNIKIIGKCGEQELKLLLERADFALDLRCDFKENLTNSDFPSKLFFYMKYDLYIFSTIMKSIPEEISSFLIPFERINNLDKINFETYKSKISNGLKFIEKNALDVKILEDIL